MIYLTAPCELHHFLHDIEDLAKAGADIIAVDGTNRPRPVDIESAVKKIHELGCLAMADCSNLEERTCTVKNWVLILWAVRCLATPVALCRRSLIIN